MVTVRPLSRRNLQRRGELEKLVGPDAVRWGARFRRVGRLPLLLEELYVDGYEHLPQYDETAPILALSHKKALDVYAIIEFMIGRPIERFQDFTVIAQGGLFGPIYPYRDLMPGFIKASALLRPFGLFAARRFGALVKRIFEGVHCHPVYREGRDVPEREAFENPEIFAGRRLTGLEYDAFVKHARRTTLHSLVAVQEDFELHNRLFFIMPEGAYCHDGAVMDLQDFMGVFACRKQAHTIFGSLSYDELCPDFFGRTAAYLRILPAVPPPERESIDDFLTEGRRMLTENTIPTASHALAAVLHEWRERPSFRRAEFRERYLEIVAKLVDHPGAPPSPLADKAYVRDRLARFWNRRASRYLSKVRGGYVCDARKIGRFAESERTVDDIEWNFNHVKWMLG